eukprot:TRINITY_DN604_c1_g4_i1.p1 TRINITY_DN604_c1_g4~~TRINITY_DN604_c1_g4_i1.p1  ORF type:complete len:433 (+),score=71.86 TRINITY_DN604_c1_g4_i1:52-1350(+)
MMEVHAAITLLGCSDSSSPVRRVLRSPAPPLFMGNSRTREETETGKNEVAGYGARKMEVARRSNGKILLFGYFIKLWVYQGWKRRERARTHQVSPPPRRPPASATVGTATDPTPPSDEKQVLQRDIQKLKDTLKSINRGQDSIVSERDNLLDTINLLGHKLEQIQYFVKDNQKHGVAGTKTADLLNKNTTNLVLGRYYRKWSLFRSTPATKSSIVPGPEVEDIELLKTYYGYLVASLDNKRRQKTTDHSLGDDLHLLLKYFTFLKQYSNDRKSDGVRTLPQGSSPPLMHHSVNPSGTLPVGCSVEQIQDCILNDPQQQQQPQRGERDYGQKFLELHEGFNFERIVWYWWCKWTRHTTTKMTFKEIAYKRVSSSTNIKTQLQRDAFRKLLVFALMKSRSSAGVTLSPIPVDTVSVDGFSAPGGASSVCSYSSG